MATDESFSVAALRKMRERGKVILDPRDPMQAARALVTARFVSDDHRLLHRHRGTFWRFQLNHYASADQETVRAEVWTFLEQAQRRGQGSKVVPFKPNRARVSDVLDALERRTLPTDAGLFRPHRVRCGVRSRRARSATLAGIPRRPIRD